MRRLVIALALFALVTVPALVSANDNELSPEDKANGWILLFDGKTLDGWMRSDGKSSLRGVDHEAINPHRCGAYMLVYDKEFSNFELELDFKVTPQLVARGLIIALIIGMIGGLMPALRAARLPVTVSLREQ